MIKDCLTEKIKLSILIFQLFALVRFPEAITSKK